jgi:hypothetical protein
VSLGVISKFSDGHNLCVFICRGLAVNQSCKVLHYDYDKFSDLTHEKALDYLNKNITREPEEVSCKSIDDAYFHYEQDEGVSFVPEVSGSTN